MANVPNKTQNIGHVTHVSWSKNKIHLILSTSNGFILVYKLNTDNDNEHDSGNEVFEQAGELDYAKLNKRYERRDKERAELDLGNEMGADKDNERDEYRGRPWSNYEQFCANEHNNKSRKKGHYNPFVPIYTYQLHKSSCTWSGIIDYSCRYVITLGGGICVDFGVDNGMRSSSGVKGSASSTKYTAGGRTLSKLSSGLYSLTPSPSFHSSSSFSNFSINRLNSTKAKLRGDGDDEDSGIVKNSGTLNLAEFMGDNTLNLSSRPEISSSLLVNENCLCLWDFWSGIAFLREVPVMG